MTRSHVFLVGIFIVIGAVFFDIYKEATTDTSLLAGTFFPRVQNSLSSSDVVDYQAGFAVIVNDEFRSFKPSLYYNLSPDVYIQGDHPNIVHVKKRGTTWNNFFKTLPLKLTPTCFDPGTGQKAYCTDASRELHFILNYHDTPNALDFLISDGDRFLVTYGVFDDLKLQNQFQSVPHPNQ